MAAFGDLLDDLGAESLEIFGLREVIRPSSTTTLESSHLAPALMQSVLIDWYDVALRPLMMPVSISSQGAWHMAATIFFWSKKARMNSSVSPLMRKRSGLI